MKCMILDDNINDQWKEIMDSLGRQHIDEANNKKKRICQERQSMISNITSLENVQVFSVFNEQSTSLTPEKSESSSESVFKDNQ